MSLWHHGPEDARSLYFGNLGLHVNRHFRAPLPAVPVLQGAKSRPSCYETRSYLEKIDPNPGLQEAHVITCERLAKHAHKLPPVQWHKTITSSIEPVADRNWCSAAVSVVNLNMSSQTVRAKLAVWTQALTEIIRGTEMAPIDRKKLAWHTCCKIAQFAAGQ